MRKILLLLVFFVIVSHVIGQNQVKIDSLYRLLEDEDEPISRATTFFNISLEYLHYEKDKCEEYLDKSEEILLKLNYTDELLVRLLNVKAGLYQNRSEFAKSDSIYDSAIQLSEQLESSQLLYKINALNGKNVNNYYRGEKEKYLEGLTKLENMSQDLDTTILKNMRLKYLIIRNRGIALAGLGKNHEALTLFMKDLGFQRNIFKTDNVSYKSSLINSLNNAALCLNSLNENDKALKLYFEALDVEKSVNYSENINRIYLNISGMFIKLKQYDKAIEYAKKINSNDSYINYGKTTNIGISFNKEGLFDKGIIYLDSALIIAKKLNMQQELFETYRDLGQAYQEINKYDTSLRLLSKANEIYNENNLFGTKASIDYSIGLLYFKKKDYSNAIKFLLEADKIYQSESSISDTYISNTEKLYESFKEVSKEKEALFWLEKLYKINNDYIKNNKEIAVSDIETKYQTQQKENEILRLNIDNEKNKTQLAQSRLINISGAGVLVMVLGMGFFFWQRKKQQLKLALLENSIHATELEKKRIGKELHDGIAGTLIKLVKDVEHKDLQLSDQLLGTYNEVRKLSHQLDNSPSHGEVFMERLIDLVPQDKDDRHFSFQINPVSLEINEPIATHLYRIIQELIANNLKYSQANNTKIHLKLDDHVLNLHYEDNGVGIQELKKGNGFKNMEDRLELIHGEMKIFKEVSTGLKINIIIPYIYAKN